MAPGVKIFPLGTGLRLFPRLLSCAVTESLTIQGRRLSPAELHDLRQWVGEKPALEPVAAVPGVGHALGLAQRRRSAQGHGRPHAVGEVGAARVHCLAGAAASADQSNALRGCADPGVAGTRPTDHWRAGPIGSAELAGGQWRAGPAGLGQSGAGTLSLSGFWRGSGREPAIRCPRWSGSPVGLPGVRGGGLEVPGPGPVYRLDGRAAAKAPGGGWPTTRVFSSCPGSRCRIWAVGSWGRSRAGSAETGRPNTDIRWWCWRPLSSSPVSGARCIGRPTGRGRESPPGARARIGIPVCRCRAKRFIFIRCGGAFGKPSAHEEPGRTTAGDGGASGEVGGIYLRAPEATGADRPRAYRRATGPPQKQQHLAAPRADQTGPASRAARRSSWPKPKRLIADLKRELFGAKADQLNAEQEEQLRQLVGDVQEQTQRPPPLSRELLEEALAQERAEQRQRAKERRRRHLPPVELEKQQVILEPPDKLCPQSGRTQARDRSGSDHRV